MNECAIRNLVIISHRPTKRRGARFSWTAKIKGDGLTDLYDLQPGEIVQIIRTVKAKDKGKG